MHSLTTSHTFLIRSGPGIMNNDLLASCLTVSNMLRSFNSTYLHTHTHTGGAMVDTVELTIVCVGCHCSCVVALWPTKADLCEGGGGHDVMYTYTGPYLTSPLPPLGCLSGGRNRQGLE